MRQMIRLFVYFLMMTCIFTQITFVEDQVNLSGGVSNLDLPRDMVVSPDGLHLYVTSGLSDAVVVFSRNTSTGALTYASSIADGTGSATLLNGSRGISISPDGNHVYVTAQVDDAITVFSRNSSTGALTWVQHLQDGVGAVDGLNGAFFNAITPDGKFVYIASNIDDAVTAFSRNSSNGQLSFVATYKDDGQGGPIANMNNSFNLTVSPDNRNVYATSSSDDAVNVFSINSSTGALTFVEFEKDGISGVDGLDGAQGVYVSPDGQHVYVCGSTEDKLAYFSRNSTTGALTYIGVYTDNAGGIDGLDAAKELTGSADGKYLFVAGSTDDAITVFSRNTSTGALTYIESEKDDSQGGSITRLNAPDGIAVDPLSNHVYAPTSEDAVNVFSNSNPSPATVSEGDIAFVRYNSDNDDDISIIVLEDIPASSTIFFTDHGWLSNGNGFSNNTAANGVITWTTPALGTLTAGSIIHIESVKSSATTTVSKQGGGSAGSVSGNFGSTGISGVGESILIYTTADNDASSTPTFIYALNMKNDSPDTSPADGWIDTMTDASATTDSSLPGQGSGSSNILTAVTTSGGTGTAFGILGHVDNYVYQGSLDVSNKATAIANLHNTSNWVSDNSNVYATTAIGPQASAPTVTSSTASSITSSSATLGGNVTADGGASVTDRGIVWGTSANPTTANTKVQIGTGTGSFSGTVSSLPASTTIHFRAYAINTSGTSYGANQSFTTLSANNAPTASSFTAANGPYENLDYTFATANFGYSDGDSDPLSHIVIEQIPAAGTLYNDANSNDVLDGGEALSNGNTVSKANLDAGNLKYIQNGSTNTSFQFEVNDGTVNSSGNYIATLNVTALPTVTLSLSPSSRAENLSTANTVTATLSHAYGQNTTVNLSFGGTATNITDYTRSSTSITVNSGSTTGTMTLTNQNDLIYEGNETVIVDISSVSNGTESGTQQVTYTINEDDAQPTATLELSSTYNPITDESGGQAYIVGKINNPAGVTVTIPLAFGGTATGGGTDYTLSASSIILSPGETADSILVTSVLDGTEEGNETVIVDMNAPTNATESGVQQVTLTINDEDLVAPRVSSIVRQSPASSPTNANSLTWDLTFNEAVQNVNTADFTVSGTTANISTVTNPAGNTYRVTASGGDLAGLNGTVTLNFAGGQNIQDNFGVALSNTTPTGTNDATFLLDNTAPAIISFTRKNPSSTVTNSDTLVYLVTFNSDVNSVDAADFAASGTTASISSVTQLTASTYDVSISGGNLASLSGSVGLNFSVSPTITDLAGNSLPNAEPGTDQTYLIDNTAPVISTFSAISAEYGHADTTFSVFANVTDAVSADTDITYSITGNTGPSVVSTSAISSANGNLTLNYANVGSSTLTLQATDAAGNSNTQTISVTVNKATLTATASDTSRAYGDANPSFTIDYTGFKNSENSSVIDTEPTASTTATTTTAVGTAPITVSGGTDDNYNINLVNGTLTINKATLTATAVDTNRIYGDANPSFTINYTGFKNSENSSVIDTEPTASTTAISTTAVGNTPITVSGGSDNNYDFNLVNGTLTINKATLTATVLDTNRIYGDANPAFTVNYTGFKNSETSSVIDTEPTAGTTAIATTAVGTTSITLSGGSDDNYDFSFVNATLTINKASLTATAADTSRAYGDANPSFTINYTGFKNSETSSVIDTEPTAATTATTTTAVGTAPITVSGGTDNNYNINLANGTLTINKSVLTVTALDTNRIYGDPNPGLTFNYSGFKNSEAAGVIDTAPTIGTIANATTNVGSVAITLSGGSDNNYSFSLVNGTLTINKATLTATVLDTNRIYGDANPAFTINYTGFKNSETSSVIDTEPTAATTATGTTAVGTASITVSGGTDNNYNFSFVSGTLTINKATVTVTADNKSKEYGAANPSLTYSYSGFKNSEDSTVINSEPSISTTATMSSVVGAYPISLSGGSDNNYNLSLVNATLTVTNKVLTVTVNDTNRIYGDANPPFTVTYSGFAGSDNPSSLSGTVTYLTSATADSNAGNYSVSASGLSSSNYTINYVNGQLTVNKANLQIAVQDTFKIYNTANPNFRLTYSGFKLSDSEAGLGGTLTFTTAATDTSSIGVYPVSASGYSSPNYNFAYTNGNLTINKAEAVVTISNLQRNFDGNPKPVTVTTIPGALTVNTSYDGSSTAPSASGDYEVIAVVNETNYFGSDTARLIINSFPQVSNPIADISVNEDFSNLTYNLDNVFDDVETSDANLIMTVSLKNAILNSNLSGHTLTLSSKANVFGQDTLLVTTTDQAGLQATDTVLINIASVNDRPTVNSQITDQAMNEDFTTFTIDLKSHFGDIETADTLLSYNVSGANKSNVVISNGVASLSSILNQNGIDTLVFSATDDSAATALDTVLFTINPVNDIPVFSSLIPDTTVNEDFDTLRINLFSIISDVETSDNALTYVVSSSDNRVTTMLNSGFLNISSKANIFGTDTLTVSVSDEDHTVRDRFLIRINSVNDLPLVQAIRKSVNEDENLAFTANDFISVFSDNDLSDSLSQVRIDRLPQHGTLRLNSNPLSVSDLINRNQLSAISYHGNLNYFGTDTVKWSAFDTHVFSNTENIIITVNPVDDPVILANPLSDITVDEDSAPVSISLDTVFTDVDNSTFNKAVISNSNTGLLTATIANDSLKLAFAADQYGRARIILRATSQSFTAHDTVMITVLDKTAPIISATVVYSTESSLSRYLSFFVESNEALKENPKLRVSNGSSNTEFTSTLFDTSKTIYRVHYEAGSGGNFTFTAEGLDSLDNLGQKVINLNVRQVNSKAKELSLSESLSLSVRPGTFDNERYIYTRLSKAPKLTSLTVLSKKYTINLSGKVKQSLKLSYLATVEKYNASESKKIGLYKFDIRQGKWLRSKSHFIDGRIEASIHGSGDYIFAYDADFVPVPDSYELGQNFPNPFNPVTTIPFKLKENGKVKIVIYNQLGQKIKTLVNKLYSAGEYTEVWNGLNDQGKRVASGIYFYRINAGSFVKAKKMVLIK